MVWSQFSHKILGVHPGNFVLDNWDKMNLGQNWDKINDTLTKKNQYLEQSATLFATKKKDKPNPLTQTFVHTSNIYYSKL